MYENESNQILKGRQISSVFIVLVLLVALFWGQFIDGGEIDEKVYQSKLESMGYQVIELEQRGQSTRGPASISSNEEAKEIGVDPWGRPYLYQYLDHQGAKVLFVWSRGPDGKSDVTSPKVSELIGQSGANYYRIADDRGTLLRLHQ